ARRLIILPTLKTDDDDANRYRDPAVASPSNLVIHHGIARPWKVSRSLSDPMKAEQQEQRTNDQTDQPHGNPSRLVATGYFDFVVETSAARKALRLPPFSST